MTGKLQNVNMSQESVSNVGAVTEGESSTAHIAARLTVHMIYEAMLTLFHFILMRPNDINRQTHTLCSVNARQVPQWQCGNIHNSILICKYKMTVLSFVLTSSVKQEPRQIKANNDCCP
jgi:hypothetical protein